MQLLRRGDSGPAVEEVRAKLRQLGLLVESPQGARSTSYFDAEVDHAVRLFQQGRGLITDGIVGPDTARALREAGWALGDRLLAFTVSTPTAGDDVAALQERLLELGYNVGRPNGVFDQQTEQALRRFQRDYGMTPDGVCGPETLGAFHRLGRKVTGGRPGLLREQELLRRAGPRMRGKRIVIDPGHGGPDRGVEVAGVTEADLMWDMARRICGRMSATGMDAVLSRRDDTCPPDVERAQFANDIGADLVISLHTDANHSMHAQGIATYHFGNGSGATSTVGEALAGLIQRELLTRTPMLDCRSQPCTWELMRRTRMPAVRLEIGYLTHLGDRRKLLDTEFRDVVAEGVLVAVKRLYLLGKDDQPTGTFTFSDVLAREFGRDQISAI